MAKKSLKKRIDDLVDALGGAEKPTLAQIRSDLVSIGTLVQELEDGQALAEKETTIAALKQENENLSVELQVANTELGTFRADREKQKEEERKKEIPIQQFDILRRLPSKHGGKGLTMLQLWREVKLRLDETEVHVDKLEKAGLIEWWHDTDDEKFWRRTLLGSELVIAKRLAGENEDEERYKHADLPKTEDSILDILAIPGPGFRAGAIASGLDAFFDTKVTEAKTAYLLGEMKKRGFVEEDTIEGIWFLGDRGTEYLAERDRL